MRDSRLQAFLDSVIEVVPDCVRLHSPCRPALLDWGIACLEDVEATLGADFLVFSVEGGTSRRERLFLLTPDGWGLGLKKQNRHLRLLAQVLASSKEL